jgi:hypothetical protein
MVQAGISATMYIHSQQMKDGVVVVVVAVVRRF